MKINKLNWYPCYAVHRACNNALASHVFKAVEYWLRNLFVSSIASKSLMTETFTVVFTSQTPDEQLLFKPYLIILLSNSLHLGIPYSARRKFIFLHITDWLPWHASSKQSLIKELSLDLHESMNLNILLWTWFETGTSLQIRWIRSQCVL